ncbi:MAG TPA: Gfo/Idh/MocA family oxidoreductase [Armatimonadota bacterium]|nr:Gfo/Idh/MocA family oxidoreductase [Armatimonadota bacterium]
MKRIRVGVIGQGRSGHDIHVAAFKLMPGRFKVVAVADPLEGRCDDAVSALGCDAYTDYREMLERGDLDLVVNATPSHLHVPVTLEILDAGFNVLTEKPLARHAADVDKIIAKAKKTGKLFAIYQQSRFAPYFQQVRKVINSGVLGRVVMARVAFNGFGRRWDWQTIQDYSAGNLLNTGPHPLDQALQLFGTDVMPKVTCIMDRANTWGDAEDFVKLILRGEGRPVIDLEISSCCAYPTHTYHVDGTLGGLKGNTTHLDWKYFKPEEAPEQHLIRKPLPGRAYCRENLKWHEKSWDVPDSQKNLFGYMSRSFYKNLYDALTTGAPLMIKPEEVRRQIAVIEEAHRQNPLSKL